MWLLLASFALCALGYLVVTVPGSWFSDAPTLVWTDKDFSVTRGTAQITPEGLLLTATDPTGTAVISINTSFRSGKYPVIAWDLSGVPDGVELGLAWRSDYAPARLFTLPLAVEGGRAGPAVMNRDANWIGNIRGIALAVHGRPEQPILLRAVAAKPMTALQVLGDRLREWFTYEHWTGASINTRVGGRYTQDLPLPFFAATVTGVALLLFWLLARARPRWRAIGAAVVAGIVVPAWLVLDAHWQFNLARQVRTTYDQYAGKSWEQRHLAAEDGDLFAFIEHVRAKLPPPPQRVFMFADVHYLRDRGAYHLYPYNVYFEPLQNSAPGPGWLRSGDYVVVYQRKGVQFDAAHQSLRWDAAAPIDAELVLVEKGAALFRIR